MFTFVFVCDVCVCCVSGCNLFCQAQEAMRHAKQVSKMQAMKIVFKTYSIGMRLILKKKIPINMQLSDKDQVLLLQ